MKNKQQIDSSIVALLIGSLPVFMLSVGHTSAVFYAVVLVSLTICFSRKGGLKATLNDWSRYKWVAAGLFSMLLAVLIVMFFDKRLLGSAFERALRIGAGTFIVLGACLSLKPAWLRQSVWGMAIAAIGAAAQAWWFAWPDFRRPEVPEYNAVSYGNLLLLASVITAFSLAWRLTRHHQFEMTLKIMALVIGFTGFIVTQTRTGWLAIPFFIFIGIVLLKEKYSIKKLVLLFLSAIILALAVFSTNNTLVKRAQDGVSEFQECMTNPVAYSSVCIRLQLWHASWEMFKQDPWLGNGGVDRFSTELKNLIDKNIVSELVVDEEFGEPHNDVLYMMASYGLPGLIGLILIYVAPGWVFLRRIIHTGALDLRVAAAMGLSVCLGFGIFGLTELMFRGMRTMGFYAVTVAWLLALSDPVFLKRESEKHSQA